MKKFAQKTCLDDLMEVKEFLNSYDDDEWMYETPVHIAAKLNKPRVMQLFLFTDFDFNKCMITPFDAPFVQACSWGSVEVVELMINLSEKPGIHLDLSIDSGLDDGMDALRLVIRFGDPRKREVYQELKTLVGKERSRVFRESI